MRRVNQLLTRIAEPENLREAFLKASRGKRAKAEVIEFRRRLDANLMAMHQAILEETVPVGNYHSFTIHDPKERVIHAAAFPERVLHHAILNICEPVFERVAIFDSYACRKGKGREAALARAQQYMRRYSWFLQMDVRKYFDSIHHSVLKAALRRQFKDAALLRLFDRIIDSYAVAVGRGLPIGSLTSQHFANFYLSPLDRFAKERLKLPYVRYMDDFVCWSDDRRALRQAARCINEFVHEHLKLRLKEGLRLNRTQHGMTFLGYRLNDWGIRLSRHSARRFVRKMQRLDRALSSGTLSELEYQQRSTCLVSFVMKAGSLGLRRQCLSGGDQRLEPREPRRQLEQQRAELPFRQSQQEQAGQPEQQPRLPPMPAAQVSCMDLQRN